MKAMWMLLVVVCLSVVPTATLADGMVTYSVKTGDVDSLSVEADVQRAAIWFRDGTWEITIQPSFPRDAGDAAWIVPFPVPPEVTSTSAEFLDSLEKLTAPVFVEYCIKSNGSKGSIPKGCGAPPFGVSSPGLDDGDSMQSGGTESAVRIWERGVTDELQYAVLEATGPDALISWLGEHDYHIPAVIQKNGALLEDQVVFVATLRADLDPNAPLSPVTFRLPGIEYQDVAYPLRLTAEVAPDEGMELLLWTITPYEPGTEIQNRYGHHRFMPVSHLLGILEGHDMNRAEWEDEWEEQIGTFLDDGGGLLREYTGQVDDSAIYHKDSIAPVEWDYYYYYGYGGNVSVEDLGLDLPDVWPAEIDEIADGRYVLSRLHGILTPAAMAKSDLRFWATTGGYGRVSNIHWEKVKCKKISAADEPSHPSPFRRWIGPTVLAAVMFLTLALIRRIR